MRASNRLATGLLLLLPCSTVTTYLRAPSTCTPAHSRAGAVRLGLGDLAPPSTAAPASSAREREAGLLRWLEANGVYLSNKAGWGVAPHPLRVESETVEDFELSGRGILASKNIAQGEAIVRIPSSILLTREAARRILGPSVVPADLNEYLAIALLLLHERAKGASSFWGPYIDILPTAEEVGQTWLWSDEDLALLSGSGVLDATASLRAKVHREHASMLETVVRPNGLDEAAYSLEAFEWAFSMLFSRAINLRETEELALVPYADLLNHSPYSASYFNYNNIPLSKDREVVLYADRAYARNDQVLISYGQKSNSELILLYGFVVDRNLFDEVEITVSLDASDPRYDEKVAFLRQGGLQPAMAFPLLIDRYSAELSEFLRLACVTPAMGPLDEYRYSEPLSVSNERASLNVLRDGCIRALQAYPQTEEEDARLMEAGSMFAALSRNARMAVKLRRNEKRILMRTIRTCETGLEKLDDGASIGR